MCIRDSQEYRGIFEKDHALSRRFQKIDVNEPSIPETIEILKGLKSRFESHHGVKYTTSALSTAAELSAVSYTHLDVYKRQVLLVGGCADTFERAAGKRRF